MVLEKLMSTSQNNDLTRQFNTDGAKNAPLVKPVIIYERLLSSESGRSALMGLGKEQTSALERLIFLEG